MPPTEPSQGQIRATDYRRLKGAALVLKEDSAALFAAIAQKRDAKLLVRLYDATTASLQGVREALGTGLENARQPKPAEGAPVPPIESAPAEA